MHRARFSADQQNAQTQKLNQRNRKLRNKQMFWSVGKPPLFYHLTFPLSDCFMISCFFYLPPFSMDKFLRLCQLFPFKLLNTDIFISQVTLKKTKKMANTIKLPVLACYLKVSLVSIFTSSLSTNSVNLSKKYTQ